MTKTQIAATMTCFILGLLAVIFCIATLWTGNIEHLKAGFACWIGAGVAGFVLGAATVRKN